MNKHFRVAVLGASGYPGGELLRYLVSHPGLEVAWVSAHSNAGRTLGEVFGHLVGMEAMRLEPTDASAVPDVDLAFLALPHGSAAAIGASLLARGVAVVDFSADWRLHDPALYDRWYGWNHPAPAELGAWVYGLAERHRDAISKARAVANPGCFPTAAVLALAPALEAGALRPEGIVVAALTGVSGAGRKSDLDFSFSELDASVKAYGVGVHRHTPEIEQELAIAARAPVCVTFTPHLVPMARGELCTCHAPLVSSAAAVRATLESAYKSEPFVHVLPEGAQPSTKQVSGTNHALIGVAADEHAGVAVITCAIDNLGKGAAGQAVQNANLMLGLDETAGLGAVGVFP